MKQDIVVRTPDFDKIPIVLCNKDQWIVWNAGNIKPRGKYTKLPVNYRTNRTHNAHDQDIWLPFSKAVELYKTKSFSGIGFVLDGNPVCQDESGNDLFLAGIDIDSCVQRDENNNPILLPEIISDMKKLSGAYWELSVSNSGIRGFLLSKAKLPNRNCGAKEIYFDKRFLTVTGGTFGGDIIENTAELRSLYRQWFPNKLPSNTNKILANGNNSSILSTHTPREETTENQKLVCEMLRHVSADCGYNEYIIVIWAIRSLNWDSGLEIARVWSRTAKIKDFDESVLQQLWANYDADKGITLGTLWKIAIDNGWNIDDSSLTSEKPLSEQNSYSIPDEIKKLNKQFAWVTSEMNLYNIDTGIFVDKNKFLTQFGNQFIVYGKTSIPLGRAWLQSKYRKDAPKVIMAPGKPSELPDKSINSWRGFSCTPVQGDTSKFTSLITHLIPDKRDRNYALIWLARMIQNPAEKFHVALTLWSCRQGSGKSLLFETVGTLFNERHHTVVGQEVFGDSFTDWMANKVFVIADEVSATNSYSTADRIKTWITASKNKINPKGEPKFDQPNAIKYVFLSNHPNAVRITKDDRRFYVIEATNEVLPDAQAQDFVNWRDNEGGLSNILYFLQKEVDTSQFNPKKPASQNRAKLEMIEDNHTDLERWINTLTDSEDIVRLLGRELATADELCERYNFEKGGRKEITSTAMTRVLRIAGIHRVEKQARRLTGIRPRVYALANIEKYDAMTDAELGSVLDNNKFKVG